MTDLRPMPIACLLLAALGLAAPARAQDVLTTHRLSAALAGEAVAAAVDACKKEGYAETAVIVDADGVPQAVLRGDGAGIHTLDSANDKAYTAVTFKRDTGDLLKLAEALGPLTAKLPHLLLFRGGLVIKLGNEVIGGIGAAGAPGGQLDEACARAGLDRIESRLK